MTTPTLAAMLAVLLGFGYLTQTVPMFGRALVGLGDRERQIDGLRGLCALAVAAHHLAYSTHWARGDGWRVPVADQFLLTMGKAAVGMFFLICAYLFWGKISRSEQFSQPIDFVLMLRDRTRRLVPAYFFAMTAALVIMGWMGQGFVLRQDYDEALVAVIRAYSFSFFGVSSFNNDILTFAAVSVAWSLRLEWIFYFSLPAIKYFHGPQHWLVILPLFIVINNFFFGIYYVDFFAWGGMAYEISRIAALKRILSNRIFDAISLILTIIAVDYFSPIDISYGTGAAVLSLAFLPIACGANWFGGLTLRGARFLGCISYSMYLLNIIVFYIGMGALTILGNSDPAVFMTDTVMLSLLALASFAGFAQVERPFMTRKPQFRQATVA